MLQTFKAYCQQYHLLQPSLHLIVAVSGGMDSVVLCHLCYQAKLSFSIAHCNFGLRDNESNRDEAFVQQLGKQYGVTVFVKRFDTERYAAQKSLSIQEAARELRYAWFEELRQEKGAAYILLAHHANDNAETVLIHFLRGTGLQGLTGMPQQWKGERRLLRPLLSFTRKDITIFAVDHHLQWVEDSSNASIKYTRNFIRHQVIPSIKKVYPQVEENLLHNIDRFQKTHAFYSQAINDLKKKVVDATGTEHRIPVNKLLHYRHTSFIYEVIKDYGFGEKQVAELIKLADSESGRYIENEGYRIIRHRRWFIVSPKAAHTTDHHIIEEATEKVVLQDGYLELKRLDKNKVTINGSANVAQVDAGKVTFPLLLRRWKTGDYFYPLGMQKKKKLSRFFIDQKLSLAEKEKIWVLESAQRIVWVAGHRMDDRFKITEHTRKVMQISLTIL